jgi:hypothetical protein
METSIALVAIVGMLVSFGLPILLVALILHYKHRRTRLTHETIAQLAERGLPVPPQLLDPPRRRQDASLRAGLILVGLGIGLGLFFYEVKAPWSIGFVPGLMGVAMLIGWAIEKRSDKA